MSSSFATTDLAPKQLSLEAWREPPDSLLEPAMQVAAPPERTRLVSSSVAERQPDGVMEYCHRCRRKTLWRKSRGIERCEGCGDRFPCARSCTHLDCDGYRAAGEGDES